MFQYLVDFHCTYVRRRTKFKGVLLNAYLNGTSFTLKSTAM